MQIVRQKVYLSMYSGNGKIVNFGSSDRLYSLSRSIQLMRVTAGRADTSTSPPIAVKRELLRTTVPARSLGQDLGK